jgi:Na+-translocating ferredoxin:NAD+ oxidoreductase subunit E
MNANSMRGSAASMHLLALCPLLAVSDTIANALGLGLAVMIIVPLTTALVGAVRGWLDDESALAAGLLVLAGSIACAELVLRAWFPDLRESLGVFLPLVLANVVIVGHLQMGKGIVGSAKTGALIAATLLVLGILRELVGRGPEIGFLLAMLPPGAFISLGLLIAARNWLAQRRS